MRGTIVECTICLIINDLHPWNNLGLKKTCLKIELRAYGGHHTRVTT